MSYELLGEGKEVVALRLSNNSDQFGIAFNTKLVFLNENVPNEGTRQMCFYDGDIGHKNQYGQLRFTVRQWCNGAPQTGVLLMPLRLLTEGDQLDIVARSLKAGRAIERKLNSLREKEGIEQTARDSITRIAKATKAKYFFASANPLDTEIRYPIQELAGFIDTWIRKHNETHNQSAA